MGVDEGLVIDVGAFNTGALGARQASLVRSFRQDLIAALGRFRAWSLGDSLLPEPLPAPASPGAARYSLEGHAASGSESLVLSCTLLDVSSSRYVWSARADLALREWQGSARSAVKDLTVSLHAQIVSERLRSLSGSTYPTTYDRWLAGQVAVESFAEASDLAASRLRRVVELAPGFAPAYSNLALFEVLSHITRPGLKQSPERLRSAGRIADEALQLDQTDARAHLASAWTASMLGNRAEAGIHREWAVSLNPHDSFLLASAGLLCALDGKLDTAKDMLRDSLSTTLSPSSAHWWHSAVIHFLGDDDAQVLAATGLLGSSLPVARAWQAASLCLMGRQAAAREAADVVARHARENWSGATAPPVGAVGEWLLSLFPFCPEGYQDRFRRGLSGAGLL